MKNKHSKTLEFNAYSESDSLRKVRIVWLNEIDFLIFFDYFSNFHDSVRPNRTSYLPE